MQLALSADQRIQYSEVLFLRPYEVISTAIGKVLNYREPRLAHLQVRGQLPREWVLSNLMQIAAAILGSFWAICSVNCLFQLPSELLHLYATLSWHEWIHELSRCICANSSNPGPWLVLFVLGMDWFKRSKYTVPNRWFAFGHFRESNFRLEAESESKWHTQRLLLVLSKPTGEPCRTFVFFVVSHTSLSQTSANCCFQLCWQQFDKRTCLTTVYDTMSWCLFFKTLEPNVTCLW